MVLLCFYHVFYKYLAMYFIHIYMPFLTMHVKEKTHQT